MYNKNNNIGLFVYTLVCLLAFCDSNIIAEENLCFCPIPQKTVLNNVVVNSNNIYQFIKVWKIMHQLPSITVHHCLPTTAIDTDSYTFRSRTDDLKTSKFKTKQSRLNLEDANIDGKLLSTKEICHTLLTIPFVQSLRLTSVQDVIPVLRQICRSLE